MNKKRRSSYVSVRFSILKEVHREILDLLEKYDDGEFGNVPGSVSKAKLLGYLLQLGLDSLYEKQNKK